MAQINKIKIGSTTYDVGINLANVSGTLTIANGGTGATTADAARTNLSVPSLTGSGASGTWPISVTGNAATATKLATARTIFLGDQFSGSASFNGSANITINGELKKAQITGGNTNTYLYRRFASGEPGTSQYFDHYGIFLISKNCDGGGFGIIKVSHRTNSSGTATNYSAKWLIRYGMAEDAVTVASFGISGTDSVYFDVYYKSDGAWPRTTITALGPCNLTLYNTSEGENAASYTYAYQTVAAGGTALHGKAYTATQVSTQAPIYGAVWN